MMDEKKWWNSTASGPEGRGYDRGKAYCHPEMQILGPGPEERVSEHAHISASAV